MGRDWRELGAVILVPFMVACAAGGAVGAAPEAAAPPAGMEPDAAEPISKQPAPEESSDPAATDDALPAEFPTETAAAPGESAQPPATAPALPPPLPSAVLTTTGVAFLLDESGSELKERLTEQCATKVPEAELAKRAACRLELREKFTADVFVFRAAPGGGIRWTVYQRLGSTLKEVHLANVKLVDETPSSFRLRSQGGKGVRPVGRGQGDLPVTMPSRTELVLEDPEFGRLVYRSKYGLVGD